MHNPTKRAAPVLDHIEARLMDNRRPVQVGLAKFGATIGIPPGGYDPSAEVQTEYRAILEVGFAQWVKPYGGRDWKPHCDQMAKRAIARELYGNVVDRLVLILESLAQDGFAPGDAAFDQVDDLIKELDGSMGRFKPDA